MNKKPVHNVTFLLLVVGGLNWGLKAILNFDLVEALFGGVPLAQKIVYLFIGLSAIYELVDHKSNCNVCSVEKGNDKE